MTDANCSTEHDDTPPGAESQPVGVVGNSGAAPQGWGDDGTGPVQDAHTDADAIDPGSILMSARPEGVAVGKGDELFVTKTITLAEYAKRVWNPSRDFAQKASKARVVLKKHGRKPPNGPYEKAKRRLPAILPSAQAPPGTKVKEMAATHHNSMYNFDLDEDRESIDLPGLRQSLRETRGVTFYATSAGGDGLYCMVLGPVAKTLRDYKYKWQQIVDEVLPADAKVASGSQSNNLNRWRFAVPDSEAWLAKSVIPLARIHRRTPMDGVRTAEGGG